MCPRTRKTSSSSKATKRRYRKANRKEEEHFIDPITVVDIKEDFYESRPKNWKRIELEEAFDDDSTNYQISRYEVFRERVRRFYLDVEKIPKDNPELIDEIKKRLDENPDFKVEKIKCD